MPFGNPVEAYEPLRTLTLDLPKGVGFVTDPQAGYPALYLIGPLVDNVELDQQAQIIPATRSFVSGQRTVVHTFTDPIPPGTYRVVVHQSRIKDTDNAAINLVDDLGEAWTGWSLTVLKGARQIPQPAEPEPVVIETSLNPPVQVFSQNDITVKLDGKTIPIGTGGLSGEILSVETTTEPSTIRMEIEYLTLGQGASLYELYLNRIGPTEDGGVYKTHFAAAGPMFDYKWAVYNGNRTDGRPPVDTLGKLIFATATMHEPKATTSLPLLVFNVTEEHQPLNHPNTYDLVTYTVTPRTEQDLASYSTQKFIIPRTLADADDTPATNPRLFPSGFYLPDAAPLASSDLAASLDLPINATIRLYVDEREVWWGQTRLVPLMITPQRLYMLQQESATTAAELSRAALDIWRASIEIMQMWPCKMPTSTSGAISVPPTFEEYILTRLALGWPREDNLTGRVTVRLGDHLYSGVNDNTLQRRLQALATLLSDCTTQVPLFPEHESPSAVARLGINATPGQYPNPSVVPDFWMTTASASRQSVIRVGDLYDPFQYTRRLLGG